MRGLGMVRIIADEAGQVRHSLSHNVTIIRRTPVCVRLNQSGSFGSELVGAYHPRLYLAPLRICNAIFSIEEPKTKQGCQP